MIVFRDALPRDAARLCALAQRSFTETFGHLYDPVDLAAFLAGHTPEGWHAELNDPRFAIRLAEDSDAAVGYAKLAPPALPVEQHGPSIELRQFYLLAAAQGTGAAQAMMDWVIKTARARGAEDMYLSVFTENHRAKRFYARYGFERIGDYAFMVGNHADVDELMRLKL